MIQKTKTDRLRTGLCAVVILCIGSLGLSSCARHDAPVYGVGIVTWIGYAPLFVAARNGYFDDEGLIVELNIMDGPGERESAYLSGEIDFFPNTPDAFAIFASRGYAGKMVMPMDESYGADGLVAREDIMDVRELQGREVGFQSGITSHFFLLYLLDQVGLTGKDVKQRNLGAGEAGAAFIAGNLDAAVTWEPWLSKAKSSQDAHVLKTTRDTPGLLADVLMVRQKVLAERPDDVLGFIRAWFRGVNFLKENPERGAEIVAQALSLSEADVLEMSKDVRYFTPEASLDYLEGRSRSSSSETQKGSALEEVFGAAGRLYRREGIIETMPEAKAFIDPAPLRQYVMGRQNNESNANTD